MRTIPFKRFMVLGVVALGVIASAIPHAEAASPVGLWKTVDDKTGQARSHVRISDSAGVLTGRIEVILEPDKRDAKCLACSGAKKNQPITGMTILEGVRRNRSATHWDGGNILDPNDGKVYRVRLTPQSDGRTLEVRGYLGPFYRNQYWVRVD